MLIVKWQIYRAGQCVFMHKHMEGECGN
jgi:hypothetical protein